MERENREDMNIVIVGHVDHGKSTIIGRLLADTNSLPEGKLQQVQERCRRNAKPFEYAFLLDALKDEQEQGITIDAARCFFKTKKRNYIIIDAPGHIEFLKNMITGAARAEAALLVIDANEGIKENSKRHGYMLAMLGIKQVTVIVNKMDLVDYSQGIFSNIVEEYTIFLKNVGIEPKSFIPVSGMEGDNVANKSQNTLWYKEDNILKTLDSFENQHTPENKPFRMPVQSVYKFTNDFDDRRIIAGTIDSGTLSVGDEVVFYPSGKKSIVKSIEGFNKEKVNTIGPTWSTGFTLEEQIYIKRGELAAKVGEKQPEVTSRIKVNLFWLSNSPLVKNKQYLLKVGTTKIAVEVEEVVNVMDASTLGSEKKEEVNRHDVAECILKTTRAIAFDLAGELEQSSRFVIVDNYEISGGGIINESLSDSHTEIRENVLIRNLKWQKSKISREERAEKYNQVPSLIIITGAKDVGKKPLAKAMEQALFDDGKIVYFLGISNVLYGVDADIKNKVTNHREEHLRRFSEVANLMLDAGTIVFATATELTNEELNIIRTSINAEQIKVVWLGKEISTDIECDLHLSKNHDLDKSIFSVKKILQDQGIIFKPW
jgi:bifunctional enzyme CysN/CysC